MLVPADLFGIIPKDTLVDTNIVIVAERLLDDVVQFDACRRPLCARHRGDSDRPQHREKLTRVTVLAGC